MIQVVGIGSALFDMLMTSESFPKEDTKIQEYLPRHSAEVPVRLHW